MLSCALVEKCKSREIPISITLGDIRIHPQILNELCKLKRLKCTKFSVPKAYKVGISSKEERENYYETKRSVGASKNMDYVDYVPKK